jgi:outer membrane protein assembly factor BamB
MAVHLLGLLLLCGETAPAPQGQQPERSPQQVAELGTRRAGVDWPGFLGPAGDSKSPERGIRTDWPSAGPKKLWQRQLGSGYGMPAVSRGRLLQFDRVDNQARLVCLHSETGLVLWTFSYETNYEDLYGYNNGPRCSPLVDDDRVYIFGAEGMLHCLRLLDGGLLWKVDTQARFGVVQNFFGVGSTPIVAGDLLIVQVGGSDPESQLSAPGQLDEVTGNGSGVVAFDKHTGRVVYTTSDELASYSSPALATFGGRNWCFVFARGGLLGFNPKNGKLDFHYRWRSPKLESVNASNPVVVGNEVFISETYGLGSSLLACRPGGYDILWRDAPKAREKAMQTHWNTPIYHEGFLYGSSGRHTSGAELRCIDWRSGKLQWSEKGLSRCSLLYVDGHLLCLGEYGTLRLLRANPKKFDPVAETVLLDEDPGVAGRPLKYPTWAAPILSHGLLYVRGRDRLICLELIPERNGS